MNDPIVLARAVVAAPDHGFDLACVWIQCNHRSLWTREVIAVLAVFTLRGYLFLRKAETVLHGVDCSSLKRRIKRGVDTKAVVDESVFAEILQ